MTPRGQRFLARVRKSRLDGRREALLMPMPKRGNTKLAVLQMACTTSMRYSDIALQLGISEQSVKAYVHAMLKAGGLKSRLHLAIFCFREGVIACPCGGNHELRVAA